MRTKLALVLIVNASLLLALTSLLCAFELDSSSRPNASVAPLTTPSCFFLPPQIEGVMANLQGIMFDGSYYWVTVETTDHPPGQIPDGRILKLDPATFAIVAEFSHPSTAPTGITFNPDLDVIVTNAPLGGPRERPWETGKDWFFVHNPDTLAVTATYTAPFGTNGVVYNPSRHTYYSVEVVTGRLFEHEADDFSIISSYQLPGFPHYPKGVTIIPDRDGAPPYIVVEYYPQPTPGIPGPGTDFTGWKLQVLRVIDGRLQLLHTNFAIQGYTFAIGDITWVEKAQRLVTVGVPWQKETQSLGQAGIYIHDRLVRCYPLRSIPPWYKYSYLPALSQSALR